MPGFDSAVQRFLTFRERLHDTLPSWLSGDLSGPFMEIVYGVSADLYAQSIALVGRMGLLLDSESPDDVLPLIASERGLPRYLVETPSQHRTRLHQAWSTYRRAGGQATLIAQLEAAGYPGARIYTSFSWPTRLPLNWWSQFWIVFPPGSHPVTSPAALFGEFTFGDGTNFGPTGITSAQIKELRELVRRWKPARWVCRGMIFQISGWSFGDGSKFGDPGLEFGGSSAEIGA